MAGWSDLLQNRMFLQYLAGAGADIAAGNPIGANVNAITQGNISAQSQAATQKKTMQMLAAMLRGESVPEGASVTHKEDGTTIKMPPGSLGDLSGGTSEMRDVARMNLAPRSSAGTQGLPNPFLQAQWL